MDIFKSAEHTEKGISDAESYFQKLIEREYDLDNTEDRLLYRSEKRRKPFTYFRCPCCKRKMIRITCAVSEETSAALRTNSGGISPTKKSNKATPERIESTSKVRSRILCKACYNTQKSKGSLRARYSRRPFLCYSAKNECLLDPAALRDWRLACGVSSKTFGAYCRWSGGRQRNLESGEIRGIEHHTAARILAALDYFGEGKIEVSF